MEMSKIMTSKTRIEKTTQGSKQALKHTPQLYHNHTSHKKDNQLSWSRYRSAANDVIYLASCMVNGEKPDKERVSLMDIEQLHSAAMRHLLTAIVGYALEECGVSNDAFTQDKAKAIRKVLLFDHERNTIFQELEKAGIWYMPLKGIILKDYYPRVGMREMADNDILYDVSHSMDLKSIMEDLGYKTEHFLNQDLGHDAYHKPPVFNFEMHRSLFGLAMTGPILQYYLNIRDKMIKDEGNAYGYHLSPEDFYIYIVAHEYKHFSHGGTGLRSILDIYIYLKKEALDMDYVKHETDKLGITDFESSNRLFAQHLFDGCTLTQDEKELLDYILTAGTYGKMSILIGRQIAKKGRLGYFLSRLFMPIDLLQTLYPVLKKHPYLYPFFVVHRLIKTLITRRDNVMSQLKWGFKTKPYGK